MNILSECKITNSILIIDSNINIMDCELYDYNIIVIFDNGISLNDHFVYKPIENNKNNYEMPNNNDIIIYRFITQKTIEEEFYKKVHSDKFNSSFSFLLIVLNQISFFIIIVIVYCVFLIRI